MPGLRKDIGERASEIVVWMADGQSLAFMCRELKCRPDTLKSWLRRLGFSYSGNQSGRGRAGRIRVPATNHLYSGSIIKSSELKKRLIRDGIKEGCCEGCGITEWLGQPAPLELHHVNGDRHDNRLENLRILCANCHALC